MPAPRAVSRVVVNRAVAYAHAVVRTRKTPQVRRDEILRACVALIDECGSMSLRFADVASRLGVSPSLIAYHFQTKDALIAESFTWAAQRDLDTLRSMTGGADSATAQLVAALAWYAPTGEARGWRLWIENWAAGLREPSLRQAGRSLDLAWKQALTAVIERGVLSGEFQVADAREAAWRITAFLDGLAVQAIVHEGAASAARMGDRTREVVAHELGVDAKALLPA